MALAGEAKQVHRNMSVTPEEVDAAPTQYSVGPQMRVAFGYRLFDAEDELVEASGIDDGFEILFGYAQLSPELEQALEGARSGQTRSVRLKAEQAFGRRDPDALIEVTLSELPEGVQVGDELEAENEAGESVLLKVLEVEADFAVLDANHPLAEQDIRLELIVEDVWPATSEELAEAEALIAADDSALLAVSSLLRRPPREV